MILSILRRKLHKSKINKMEITFGKPKKGLQLESQADQHPEPLEDSQGI
jgi:hypothetical protein